jgi:hypothetical protein
MASNLLFYPLLLVALVLICLLIHVRRPDDPRVTPQTPRKLDPPRRKRSKAPKPLTGLIHKPLCEACEQRADACFRTPGAPPPVIAFARGRRRTVDRRSHFCPDPDCPYPAGSEAATSAPMVIPVISPIGSFSLSRATGISMVPMVQFFIASPHQPSLLCAPLQVWPKAWASGARARVIEIDPNMVLQWLMEAAEQLQAFSAYFL